MKKMAERKREEGGEVFIEPLGGVVIFLRSAEYLLFAITAEGGP